MCISNFALTCGHKLGLGPYYHILAITNVVTYVSVNVNLG